jgi:hypothetical protein
MSITTQKSGISDISIKFCVIFAENRSFLLMS